MWFGGFLLILPYMTNTTKINPLLLKLLNRLEKEERHLQTQTAYVQSIRDEITELQRIIDERGW